MFHNIKWLRFEKREKKNHYTMDTQMLLVIKIVMGKNNQKYPTSVILYSKNHMSFSPQECDSSLDDSNQPIACPYKKFNKYLLSEQSEE